MLSIIEKYYDPNSRAYDILVTHSQRVKDKAVYLAERVADLKPDIQFVKEAAMLHDIGIFLTHAPGIGCHGKHPYILHGPLGRDLLETDGLPRHALVCERHTGVGLSKADIVEQGLPLPHRNMLPVTLEEKIICFADTFYGKNPEKLQEEKTIEKIVKKTASFGPQYIQRLEAFRKLFRV